MRLQIVSGTYKPTNVGTRYFSRATPQALRRGAFVFNGTESQWTLVAVHRGRFGNDGGSLAADGRWRSP